MVQSARYSRDEITINNKHRRLINNHNTDTIHDEIKLTMARQYEMKIR